MELVRLEIVIPFYGPPPLLREAVESVLAQTNPHWRLTIVDDRYPDDSVGAWARAINDPRVSYIRNDQNLGVSANFQRSIELMEGAYGVILGGDDRLLPNYVEEALSALRMFPTASIVQVGVEVIDEHGSTYRPLADRVKTALRPRTANIRELSGEYLAASLARGNWAYFPSLVWNTSLLKRYGFRSDLSVVLDLQMIFDIIVGDGTLVLISAKAFQYRRHSASVSSVTAFDGSRFEEERSVLIESAKRFTDKGWPKAARVANRHLSSRLNALSLLPRSMADGQYRNTATLLRYALGLRMR